MVAGVQYAPVIRPGRLPVLDDVDAAPRGRRGGPRRPRRRGSPRPRPAVAARLRDRAAHATGAASEVLAATATLAQDRAWLGAAEKRINAGAPAVRAVVGGGRPVRRPVHPDRRPDGRTGHRSARHPRPRHRRTERTARARRPAARRAVDPVRRGPRARRHRGPGPDARRRAGHHAGRADQPHRDHRPPARHPVRGGRRRARRGRRPAPWCSSTAPAAPSPSSPDAGRGRRCGRPLPSARPQLRGRAGPGPGATADGHAVAILANVQDGAAARAAARDSCRGRRAVPHRTVLPQPRHRADRRRAGPDLRRGARGLRRAQGRDQDAGRRLGQAAEVRRASRGGQPGARRARHPDRRRATRRCWSGSSTRSPPRPSAPATRRG